MSTSLIRLPADTTVLTDDLTCRIPKILIGNPGRQERLGWDVIPNWRPQLRPEVRLCPDGTVRLADGRAPRLPDSFRRVLPLCDGRTFWEIVRAVNEGDPAWAIEFAADQVKVGRVLGVLSWDFLFEEGVGVFFRRRTLGAGPELHDWYYVSAFTKTVFDHCSGAFSCREIADLLVERGVGRAPTVLRRVVESCISLVEMEVVGWIDDEQLRAARLDSLCHTGE